MSIKSRCGEKQGLVLAHHPPPPPKGGQGGGAAGGGGGGARETGQGSGAGSRAGRVVGGLDFLF